MSLRLAALDGLIALSNLYATDWTDPRSTRLWDNRVEAISAQCSLKQELGFDAVPDGYLSNDIALALAIAERMERRDETRGLASEILAAIRRHEAAIVSGALKQAAE